MTALDFAPEMKEFTIREIVEAVRENGLEHLRGEWFHSYDGKITGGCVLGQAAYNLSVVANEGQFQSSTEKMGGLFEILNLYENKSEKYKLTQEDIERLYEEGWNVDEWDPTFTCGSVITSFNDLVSINARKVPNPKYNPDVPENWQPEFIEVFDYYLPTYEAVVEMVEDVLAPYLDENVMLPVKDYSWNPFL